MADPKQALIALMEKNAPETLKRAREAKAARDAAKQRAAAEEENDANEAPRWVHTFEEERKVKEDNVIRDWRSRSAAAERAGDAKAADRVMRERAATEKSTATNFFGESPLIIRAHDAIPKVDAEDKAREAADVAWRKANEAADYGIKFHQNPDRAMYEDQARRRRAEGWTYDDNGWHPPPEAPKQRPETKRESEDRALRELEADMARLRERLRGPTLAGAGARKR